MAFKRYGGSFSNGSDSGSSKVALVGVVLLVLSVLASLLLAQPGLVIVGFIFLFAFTALGVFFKGGATSGIREERHEMNIEKAISFYEAGEFTSSYEAFNKAKIYGEIPKSFQSIYKEVERKRENA